MTSSQMALTALAVNWLIATVTLTSAARWVARRQPFSFRRYVVAGVISTLMLGGLLLLTDRGVGRGGTGRTIEDFTVALAVSSLALGAGAWWTGRSAWANMRGLSRFLTLFLIEAVVVLVAGYFLI